MARGGERVPSPYGKRPSPPTASSGPGLVRSP